MGGRKWWMTLHYSGCVAWPPPSSTPHTCSSTKSTNSPSVLYKYVLYCMYVCVLFILRLCIGYSPCMYKVHVTRYLPWVTLLFDFTWIAIVFISFLMTNRHMDSGWGVGCLQFDPGGGTTHQLPCPAPQPSPPPCHPTPTVCLWPPPKDTWAQALG